MKADRFQAWPRAQFVTLALCLALVTSCATPPAGSAQEQAAYRLLRTARSTQLSAETRAANYLEAAALSALELRSDTQSSLARTTYNSAAAEITILLRSAEGGRLWNRPLTLSGSNTTYNLRLQPAGPAVWSPSYFTSFELASSVKEKLIKDKNFQDGIGGTLVGVRLINPPEKFAPKVGITAPVTATLDFNNQQALLTLQRPTKQPSAPVEGKVRPLAADFSAPISYHKPPNNVLLVGLMAALRSHKYMETTGLYFLQPYDPDRIPVVFVHGLMSTPFTWVRAINGVQADPEIRKHYQFWVFAYPTGNPILYSALRFREELAKIDQLYPNHRPIVLVGHSMGGIISNLQVTTVTRSMWEKRLGESATSIFSRQPANSVVRRAMTFRANPRVNRVVFVCSPLRGSDMASSGLGKLGISLISLPMTIASTIKDSFTTSELEQITGETRLPNSVSGLKPNNPALKVLNDARITVPYHSIIGDRGKGDSPNSSDGVVAYWSSHLDGAQSEQIVPGSHAATELPETIAELKRILLFHLRKG